MGPSRSLKPSVPEGEDKRLPTIRRSDPAGASGPVAAIEEVIDGWSAIVAPRSGGSDVPSESTLPGSNGSLEFRLTCPASTRTPQPL